jgi:hypothetical protein
MPGAVLVRLQILRMKIHPVQLIGKPELFQQPDDPPGT